MKTAIATAITVVVATAVTWFMTMLGLYFWSDRAEAVIGPVVSMQEENYAVISIANGYKHSLADIRFAVPPGTAAADVVSSHPVEIEMVDDSAGTASMRRMRVSGIESRQSVALLVPIQALEAADHIALLSPAAAGISVRAPDEFVSLGWQAAESAWPAAIMYAIFLAVLAIVRHDMTERLRKTQKELDRLGAKWRREKDNLQRAVGKQKVELERFKKFLVRRISDYEKENQFWRDTLRKMLVEEGRASERESRDFTGRLFGAVTNCLRTYTTQRRRVSVNAVQALESLIEEFDSGTRQNKKPQNRQPRRRRRSSRRDGADG